MRKSIIANIYVVFAVLLWASTPAVGKLLLLNLNNLQVLFFTSFIASISLFIISLTQNKIRVIKGYKFKDYLKFAYMGFIGIFLYYVFFYGALKYLPAQEASVINYLWPIIVLIFAGIILREKFTLRKFLGIILSFIGVFIVGTRGNIFSFHFSNLTGILLAIAGAVSYGLFSVLGKKYDYERFTSMLFYFIFTFIFVAIAVLIFSSIPNISVPQLAGLLWLGIFPSGLGFVFWFLALKYGETAKMSNIIYLTPFVSLIYIHFLVSEKILLSSIIGLILIIMGILIQSTRKNILRSASEI
jgi:drug/metabolite transporter (DMT)-like permease